MKIEGGLMDEHGTWQQLAAKLTDAGLEDAEAFEWVRDCMATAWEEGYASAGHSEMCGSACNCSEDTRSLVNPYLPESRT